MNSDKQTTPIPTSCQQHPVYDDEISLIDIYLTIKRNSKLFLTVIILSFFISLAITYSRYKSEHNTIEVSNTPTYTTEYVLIIEIGRIFGLRNHAIDSPQNLLEKIKKVYIPKLNQTDLSAKYIKDSDLIVIAAKKTSGKVDYNKMLLSIANDILKDHNEWLISNGKSIIKPTKIIQQPTKRIIKNKNNKSKSKSKSKSKVLIPVLGIVLGVVFGFLSIFIKEFLKKAKEVESAIKKN